MKSIYVKVSAILLLCLIMLPLFSACTAFSFNVGVEESEDPDVNESGYVEWQVSDDGDLLYAGDLVYQRYYPGGFVLEGVNEYLYYNTVSLPEEDYEYCTISAPYHGADYIWVSNTGGYCYIYATEEGTEALDAFRSGDIPIFHLISSDSSTLRAYPTLDLIDALDYKRVYGMTQVPVDVTELERVPCYTLRALEETESIAYDYGAVYLYKNDYYYLNYTVLDNSCFDAEGNFSYRSGTVYMTRLDTDLSAEIDALIADMDYLDYSYTYEEDESFEDILGSDLMDSGIGLFIFWVSYAFIAFICPLPFLVLGLILPSIGKLGKPKYWYSSAILAGIWILLALILMIILLL